MCFTSGERSTSDLVSSHDHVALDITTASGGSGANRAAITRRSLLHLCVQHDCLLKNGVHAATPCRYCRDYWERAGKQGGGGTGEGSQREAAPRTVVSPGNLGQTKQLTPALFRSAPLYLYADICLSPSARNQQCPDRGSRSWQRGHYWVVFALEEERGRDSTPAVNLLSGVVCRLVLLAFGRGNFRNRKPVYRALLPPQQGSYAEWLCQVAAEACSGRAATEKGPKPAPSAAARSANRRESPVLQ